MRPIVEVRDLHFSYDDGTVALAGIDFQLLPNENVALLGANGSGKTTFVLHLNGLLSGSGEVRVDGIRVEPSTFVEVRRKIGLVFQDSETQLFMPTVLEDVMFGPLNLGLGHSESAERAATALEQTGMAFAARKAPYHLSAGEKKRVAIAGILAMRPSILILDEPTTFLDPPGRRAIIELLHGLPQAKIVVTHDVEFAEALCQRAAFFQKGKIAADGTVSEVAARFGWQRQL